MGVIALQQNLEQEQSGEIRSLELVALRYTGNLDSLAVRGALNSQGKWPGTAPLNNGIWYFALVPDEGLAYLENREDLDLVYADDAERFAEALLSKHRLPENVFGRGHDRDLRERVDDALGLEDPMEAGPVENQLQEVAGIEEDEAGEDTVDSGRVSSLANGYSRSQLSEAVKAVREDTGEFNLRGADKTSMAEFLAEQNEAAVHDALEGGAGGGDD